MNWLNCFACKQKAVDDVKTLDFSRASIADVPPEVFNFERTLENLHLDGNKVKITFKHLGCYSNVKN